MAAKALAAARQPQPERIALLVPGAVRFYLDERSDGREGWRYPSFLPPENGSVGGHVVYLDEALWDELRAEAAKQGVDPERLLQHAVFYYGAASDEGRLTELIAEELRREAEASGEREGG
jgi:hypothetical protein